MLAAAEEAVRAAGIRPTELEAIGITNQRETTVLWERATGRPVAPAIVWQDRRTAERCRTLPAELLRARTGLVPDPYFSATKLEWLLARTDLPRSRARVRHGRHMARLEADRRPRACHRPDQRVPDDAARPGHARLVARAARPVRHRSGAAAPARPLLGGRRRGRTARRHAPDRGDRRRPAGLPVRPRLLRPRPGQGDVRHGQLRARERGSRARAGAGRAARDRGCLGRLCVRGRDPGERRRDPVAAGRARDPRRRGGERAAGALGRVDGRRLVRAGVRRPRLAALERGGARADQRDHARHDPGAARSRRARGNRVPGRGRPRPAARRRRGAPSRRRGEPRTGF